MSGDSNCSQNSIELRTAFFTFTVLVLVTCAASSVYRWFCDHSARLSEFYSVSEVVDMTVLYASVNHGQLPENWNDLESLYQNQFPGSVSVENRVSRLKSQVFVDFVRMGEAPSEHFGSTVFICRDRISKRREIANLLPFEVTANERIRKLLRYRERKGDAAVTVPED